MYLQVNGKQWEIGRARQSVYSGGVQFSFTFKSCLEVEELITDLAGIENGFTFKNKTYTGYSISDLATVFDDAGFEVTSLVVVKPFVSANTEGEE